MNESEYLHARRLLFETFNWRTKRLLAAEFTKHGSHVTLNDNAYEGMLALAHYAVLTVLEELKEETDD